MFAKSFSTFLVYLALASIVVCPCEVDKNYLGIYKLTPIETPPSKKKKLKHNFFLGNGIKEKDPKEAANKLLHRDHKDVAGLSIDYYNGKLGAKFLPPSFCSNIPHVVNPDAYEKQRNLKNHDKNYDETIRAEEAERSMFQALET